MSIKLYVLPGSHPCAAVEVAMRRKGIPFQQINLLPLVPVAVGPLLYGGNTVPGMRIDGERLVGSRTIMRRLDLLAPEPPLLPADPAERERVLEAERWGDDVFQSVPRRILDAGFLRNSRAMESYAGDVKLPLPRAMLRPALPLTAKLMARRNHAQDEPGAGRPRRALRAISRRSTPGSRRGCSAARSPTPPTCRSAPRSACWGRSGTCVP